MLESELRVRDQHLRELRTDVARLEVHNEALQRELAATQQGTVLKVAPELSAPIHSLRRISLGRSTGGYDQDRQLGDEALQVVIEPRDGEDQVVKAPGTVSVTALEVSPEGVKTPLSSWNVPAEELRRSWRSGFFTTGYVLILPFQKFPHSERVRVIARFETPDGRVFETDRDVRVVPRPDMLHDHGPEPATLPLPRPLEPVPPSGPNLPPPTGVWQTPSLEGAVRMNRPQVAESGP